jgi:hypothetical protein
MMMGFAAFTAAEVQFTGAKSSLYKQHNQT